MIQAVYLESLGVGSHTVELFFTDGSSGSGTFQVKAATSSGGSDTKTTGTTPKTGDTTPAALAVLGLLCALATLGLYRVQGNRKVSSAKHRR